MIIFVADLVLLSGHEFVTVQRLFNDSKRLRIDKTMKMSYWDILNVTH